MEVRERDAPFFTASQKLLAHRRTLCKTLSKSAREHGSCAALCCSLTSRPPAPRDGGGAPPDGHGCSSSKRGRRLRPRPPLFEPSSRGFHASPCAGRVVGEVCGSTPHSAKMPRDRVVRTCLLVFYAVPICTQAGDQGRGGWCERRAIYTKVNVLEPRSQACNMPLLRKDLLL